MSYGCPHCGSYSSCSCVNGFELMAWLMKDPDFRKHIIKIQEEVLFGGERIEKKIEHSS